MALKCELSLRVRESKTIQNLFFVDKNPECAKSLTKQVLRQMKETLVPVDESSKELVSRLDLDFSSCSKFLSLLFQQCQSLSENLFNTGDGPTAIKALSFLSSQILDKDLLALFSVLVDKISSPSNFDASRISFEFQNELLLNRRDSSGACPSKLQRKGLGTSLDSLLEALSKKSSSSFSLNLTSSPKVSFSHSNFAIVVLLNLLSSLLILVDELAKALHTCLTKNFPSPPPSLLSMLSDLPNTRKAFSNQGKRLVKKVVGGIFEKQVHQMLKSALIPLRPASASKLQLKDFSRKLKRHLGRFPLNAFLTRPDLFEVYLPENFFQEYKNEFFRGLQEHFEFLLSKHKMSLEQSICLQREYSGLKDQLLLYLESHMPFTSLGDLLEVLTSESQEVFDSFRTLFADQITPLQFQSIATCRSFAFE